eukprot:g15412.t1
MSCLLLQSCPNGHRTIYLSMALQLNMIATIIFFLLGTSGYMDKSNNTTQDSEIPSDGTVRRLAFDAGTDQRKKRAPLSSQQLDNITQHREERQRHGGSFPSPSSALTSPYSIPNQSSTISSIHGAASTSPSPSSKAYGHDLAEKSSLITQDNRLSLSAIEQDNRLSLPAVEHEPQLCAPNQNFSQISQISHTSSLSSSHTSSQSLSQSLNASAGAASTSTLLDAQNLLQLLLQLPPGQQQSLIAQLTSAKPSSSTDSTDTQQMKIPDAVGGPNNQRNQVSPPLGVAASVDTLSNSTISRLGTTENTIRQARAPLRLGLLAGETSALPSIAVSALGPFGASDSYLSSAITSTLTSIPANFAPLGASDTYVSATTSALSSPPVAYGTLGASSVSYLSAAMPSVSPLKTSRKRAREPGEKLASSLPVALASPLPASDSYMSAATPSTSTSTPVALTTSTSTSTPAALTSTTSALTSTPVALTSLGPLDSYVATTTPAARPAATQVQAIKTRGSRPRRSQPARPKKKLRMADTDGQHTSPGPITLSEEEKPSIQSVQAVPSRLPASRTDIKGLDVPWTAEEDEYVYKRALVLGSQWKKIGDAIRRSGPAVKHRFEEHIVHSISLPHLLTGNTIVHSISLPVTPLCTAFLLTGNTLCTQHLLTAQHIVHSISPNRTWNRRLVTSSFSKTSFKTKGHSVARLVFPVRLNATSYLCLIVLKASSFLSS